MNRTHPFLRLGLLAAALVLVGQGCVRVGPGKGPDIVVWGVLDDAETMEPIIKAFEKASRKKRITVEYKKVSSLDQYEEFLRTALAERRGPDVFLLNAAWMPRWLHTVLPAPPDLVPVRSVQEQFVDTVAADLIVQGRVLALPLFVDSLALYYNKDIFNTNGIPAPPRTWQEVRDVVKRVTKFNPIEAGQIDQHGIALGAGRNVDRAPDVLSALMLQNGAEMFRGSTIEFGRDARAMEALRFLTDFANPKRDVYTWQLFSDYSIDTFAEEETAMMVNYSYHRPTLRLKNPRLNFGIAPLPQSSTDARRRLTYAGYWAFAVSQQTSNPDAAWDLITFITSTDPAREYLAKSGYPPARRDLVSERQNDPEIGVFVEQSLIARVWPQPDNRVVDRVFKEAMDAVVTGRDTVEGALQRAAAQIQVAADALAPDFPPNPAPTSTGRPRP